MFNRLKGRARRAPLKPQPRAHEQAKLFRAADVVSPVPKSPSAVMQSVITNFAAYLNYRVSPWKELWMKLRYRIDGNANLDGHSAVLPASLWLLIAI